MNPHSTEDISGPKAFAVPAGCTSSSPVQRYAWVTGLKSDQAARYEDLHARVWPGVNKMIKTCHIRNFSIHKCEINGSLYLFAYLEYTGTDFDADMKRMAEDPETQRWWKETAPCQKPLADAAAKGKTWSDMKEVYFLA
jgi:L-rhamnose mutarotase